MLSGNRGEKREEYTHDLFTEEALSFIESNKQRPFFLYLAYTIPHWSDFEANTPESQIVPSDAPYTDRDWPQVEKNYAAMVTRMDSDVGRIMELLKTLGLDENTIVFFTSDNGPCAGHLHDINFFDSNGPLRGVKRDLYEGGIRVPMVVRWPGKVPSGQTSDRVWAFWDVMPTLAELAGLPSPKGIDGISMAPTLLGQEQEESHEYLYWDYGHVRDTFKQAVRFGDWKGVRVGRKSKMEIYDLKNDLGEIRNVAGEHPDLAAQAEEYMKEALVESPDYPIGGPKNPG